jgi:hypothetical protein
VWTVTQRFRDTVAQNHEIVSTCTITTPGAATLTVPIASGAVAVDRTQQIRRTAPGMLVQGGTDAFALLSTPGTQVVISHGFLWGGTDQELIPMLTGELTSAALAVGDGLISISVADRWQKLAASTRLAPYTPATTARRVDEIIAAVTGVFSGITVRNTASDTGTVGTAQAWTSRADQVAAYSLDGGLEVYFAPDGALVLRDVPVIIAAPVWTIKTGPGGTLKALTRTRPLDRLYNTVVLTPASADPLQTWAQVTAQISYTANPRHPNRIGIRPYTYQSPTALTTAQAQTIAGQILTKIQGTTETLSLTAMGMAALEGGDVVQILTPSDTGDAIVSNFVQTLSIDLAAGDMTATTMNSTEFAA